MQRHLDSIEAFCFMINLTHLGENQLIRKIVFTVVIALGLSSFASPDRFSMPKPHCGPCPQSSTSR
jgi:hypothetical protein